MKKLSLLLAIALIALFANFSQAQQVETKKWTFMVFINGDNNLDRFGVLDIQEMEKAGISKDINIVVEIDRGYGKPARRYDVTGRAADAKADDWGICAKNVGDLGEIDSGDYKEVVNYVNWVKQNYPAENYSLVLWNHGAGWKKKANEVLKGVCYDDQSGHHISTKDLGVMTATIQGILGKRLDILAFDACLMQMIEVSYEIRENVKYMVASEETEPGDGWPYELVCSPLAKNPAMTAEEFARLITQAYAQSYNGKKSTTQSTVDCDKLEDLAVSIDALAQAIMGACAANTAEVTAVKNALAATQKYAYADNIDLGHFAQMLAQVTKDEKVKEAINNLTMVYGKAVIENQITGTSTKYSTGTAIYFPKSSFNAAYDTIKFSKFSWDEMVKAVTGAKTFTESAAPASQSTSSANSGSSYDSYPDVYPMPGGPFGGFGGFGGIHPHIPPMPAF